MNISFYIYEMGLYIFVNDICVYVYSSAVFSLIFTSFTTTVQFELNAYLKVFSQ